MCSGESYTPHGQYVDDDDEDDDHLGYYPDGVKRTLTDDQIAMFRHSEIYTLIRQRQVRKENQEAELGVEAASATESKVTPTQEPKRFIVHEGDSDDEEEYLRFLESEKRKAEANSQRNKRRKTNHDDHTHRRIARELDIVVADEQMLDYDEGPSKATEAPKTESPRQEKGLGEEYHATAYQARDRRPEGRKIWWPCIQEG